jgi:hypothetical protein
VLSACLEDDAFRDYGGEVQSGEKGVKEFYCGYVNMVS